VFRNSLGVYLVLEAHFLNVRKGLKNSDILKRGLVKGCWALNLWLPQFIS
jgi:hypothetical protein